MVVTVSDRAAVKWLYCSSESEFMKSCHSMRVADKVLLAKRVKLAVGLPSVKGRNRVIVDGPGMLAGLHNGHVPEIEGL